MPYLWQCKDVSISNLSTNARSNMTSKITHTGDLVHLHFLRNYVIKCSKSKTVLEIDSKRR